MRGAVANIRRDIYSIFLAALFAALTATHAEALDDPAGMSRSITVTYADLNLDSEAGAVVLLRRIKRAASKVCGDEPAAFELWKRRPYRDCVNDAMYRAVTEVNRPLVTRLYTRERFPGSWEFLPAVPE